MAEGDSLLLVLTNVPDEAAAASISRALVEECLAACVNVLAACRSVYRWHEAIEEAGEWIMLVKTTVARHDACVQRLAALHPYEVPEIVTLAPQSVWPAYAAWAAGVTREPAAGRD